MIGRWTYRARQLKTELHALALVAHDPRTPWIARLVVILVVAYAFSPLDLIPDPVPVLGYLDDLVLLALGILLARWLIPAAVLADCRAQAAQAQNAARPRNWIAAGVIVVIWVALVWTVARLVWRSGAF